MEIEEIGLDIELLSSSDENDFDVLEAPDVWALEDFDDLVGILG